MKNVYAYVTGEHLGEATPELEEASEKAVEGVVGAAWVKGTTLYRVGTHHDMWLGMNLSVYVADASRGPLRNGS
ncbi:hypothetical protein LZC95_07835 [Pendulispora brunnea]|uniref:Uncharacterized protein n=1 Tax=Pendulispora brunnea TaxID=2905690 RepID=A0ABZ2KGQ0_9BACT